MLQTVLIFNKTATLNALQMHLWTHCPDVLIRASAKKLSEADTLLRVHHPELVIANLALPDGSVLELLTGIVAEHGALPFELLVVDTNPENRETVLRLGARAFILEPYPTEELVQGVSKARDRIHAQRYANVYRTIAGQHHHNKDAEPADQMTEPTNAPSTLAAASRYIELCDPVSKGKRLYLPEDILAVRADGGWSRVIHISAHGQIAESLDKRRLGEWEDLLLTHFPMQVMRVHDSALVHLMHVTHWEHRNKKDAVAFLHSGHALPVSRQRKKDFRERWARMRQIVLASTLLVPPIEGKADTRTNDDEQ